ncbi:MAG: hypothetical protein ACYDCO_21185 [Armatimonadota bacterium]
MVSNIPASQTSGEPSGQAGKDQLVIVRSADPLQLLANILQVAGVLAAQWGEEILLHLRVASLWLRIGKKPEAIQYLRHMADLHSVDTFHLGSHHVRDRIDMMKYFLDQVGLDSNLLYSEEHRKRKRVSDTIRLLMFWRYLIAIITGKPLNDLGGVMLNADQEETVQEIVKPSVTWLENAYLTPVPGDTKYALVQELNSIKEYADPDESARQLLKLFDHCRNWHERKSDTPIWIHELDDIGTRAMYLAVMIDRPQVIATYIERCIDALNERPLALMPNVAMAIAGLGYMARKHHRDELLHRALDFLPRLPEHERCISALELVEVLVERDDKM